MEVLGAALVNVHCQEVGEFKERSKKSIHALSQKLVSVQAKLAITPAHGITVSTRVSLLLQVKSVTVTIYVPVVVGLMV